VVTVSDGVAGGTRQDRSGDVAAESLVSAGFDVRTRAVVADERADIEDTLRRLVDDGIALVVTTGGTGFGPRDVTPEATRAVLEREAPGIAELLRVSAFERFPRAALSRGLAGTRNRTLVVNLPGSPGGVSDALQALDGIVAHAVAILRGEPTEHSAGGGRGAEGGESERSSPHPLPPALRP
jgi:molybdenum cofactor biosynthesis protein B